MAATHTHFIGIGGTGLSAIARVLVERGEIVSGSDRQLSPLAQSLQQLGVRVYLGHAPENIAGADLVVRSSAVPEDNPEVLAALQQGIPVLKRSEYLGHLLKDHTVLAVAGTHGKTTTTAMLAWTLTSLGYDPSYIIGGVSNDLGSNAHAGTSALFVIEADEYDYMFLGLEPAVAVVTNIEHDHPDCFPTEEKFFQAFKDFAARIKPDGNLVACLDDTGSARLLKDSTAHAYSYAVENRLHSTNPDYVAVDLEPQPEAGYSFQAYKGTLLLASVTLQVPGLHNVRNALACLAVIDLLGFSTEQAALALSQFTGTGRRFELRGVASGITIIDDYAHHPTEIRATLAAARQRYPSQDIWIVWQPHTYTRTRTLLDDFLNSFEHSDHLLVTEIYAARESQPQNGFSARTVVSLLKHPDVRFTASFASAKKYLLENMTSGSVVLVLSAGDANQISIDLLNALQENWRKENA